jgi:hypothetical protein
VPPQEEQETPSSLPDAAEKLSPPILPFPRHAEQFPSPGESQSMQTWVVMARLPDTSAILIAFFAHVKRNKFDKTNGFDQKSVDIGSRTRVRPWIPTQATYKTAQPAPRRGSG